MSFEDAVSAVKDLTKCKFLKNIASFGLLIKDGYDSVKISNVEDYYMAEMKQLQLELSELGREMSPVEIFLMKKYKAELAYCHQARIKTNIGIVKEVIGLIKDAEEAIRDMFAKTKTLLQYSLDAFEKKHEEHLRDILVLEDEIDEIERQLQEAHIDRLTRGECDAETGMIYTDVVSNLERVADHSTNIAFSIMTDVRKPDLKD